MQARLLATSAIGLALSTAAQAQSTRAQMNAANDAAFYACGVHCITPDTMHTYHALETSAYGFLNDANTWAGAQTFAGPVVLPAGTAFRNLGYALTAPASSSAACSPGQQSYAGAYVYLCTATNTWGRALTSDFSGNVTVPGALTLGTALTLANGGTGATAAQGARLNLGVSKMGVYSLADYCTSPCTTTAQQTDAFTTIAGLINAAGGGVLWIPYGQNWHFDTTRAGGPMVFTSQGASIDGPGAGSAVVLLTGGSFAQWTTGFGRISGFRIYEGDNPASGVQISLKNTFAMDISDLQIGGGCLGLELASAVGVHATNVTIMGDNTSVSCAPTSVATGVTGLLVHRSSSAGHNPAENHFTNFNIQSANKVGANSSYTMKNAIVVSSTDGLLLSDGHAGFGPGDALLIQPENANDVIDNIRSTEVNYDTSLRGIHFAPYAGGASGYVGDNSFTSGMVEISANEGILMEDPSAVRTVINGMTMLQNGNEAIKITAGTNTNITGIAYGQNNYSGGSYSNLLIGGTAASVSVDGGTYQSGASVPVPYHVVIADAADYVSIGSASYKAAATGDISNTSSGTHNGTPGFSTTDQTLTAWPNIVNIGGLNGNYLRDINGGKVVNFRADASVALDYLIIQSHTFASGLGVDIYGGGSDGAATPVKIASLTGPTTLGNATVGVTVPGPAAVSGASTLAAVSMTSQTLTSLAESTTAPTIASGFCTTPTIGAIVNGTSAFQFTVGTSCAGSTGVLTLPTAAHGWRCNLSDISNPNSNKPDQTAYTATSASFTNYLRTTGAVANWTASDVIIADCHGF